ncbi:MAG TPA: IclR family transcriptional regulator C-terminal domain-containing protein [Steroidobacteraceae bacterium]|nr:IclR family transcriptional regulator C-terminal domain-containing protein [Steroidobacteraceae bacterium]
MPRLKPQAAAKRAANPLGRDFSEGLSRGLQIIATFGPSARALTLSEVARRVDLPRATARRSLLTLAQLGYVREDSRLFSLTPRVLELAVAYLSASPAATVLQPCCERLAAEFGETFSVAALDGEHAVMIAYATPRRMYMDAPGIGLRLPAFCSAVGRVLLAGLAETEREKFLVQLRPKAITKRTVTDKAGLRAILQRVAAAGFALAEEEAELGFRSLAVPVRRAGGAVAFALNTGMHVDRGSAESLQVKFLARLRAAADELGAQII